MCCRPTQVRWWCVQINIHCICIYIYYFGVCLCVHAEDNWFGQTSAKTPLLLLIEWTLVVVMSVHVFCWIHLWEESCQSSRWPWRVITVNSSVKLLWRQPASPSVAIEKEKYRAFCIWVKISRQPVIVLSFFITSGTNSTIKRKHKTKILAGQLYFCPWSKSRVRQFDQLFTEFMVR